MSGLIIKYDLDLTGSNPSNRVLGEEHILNAGVNRSLVPKYGAYYTKDMIVRDKSTGIQLEKQTQYSAVMFWEEPTERSGLEVCTAIVITDPTVSNEVIIEYQAVGGLYSNIASVIVALMGELQLDDRPVSWGDVFGRPETLPPASHLHDVGDIYGFEYVVEALNDIKEAIMLGGESGYADIEQQLLLFGNDFEQQLSDLSTTLNDKIDAKKGTDYIPGDGIDIAPSGEDTKTVKVDNTVVRKDGNRELNDTTRFNGKVGVLTAAPDEASEYSLDVNGTIRGTIFRPSDPILKEVLEDKYLTLKEIATLRSVIFKWKYGSNKGKISSGVLADEVEVIAPFVIIHNEATMDEEGIEVMLPAHRTVDYEALNVLINLSLAKVMYNAWYRRVGRFIGRLFGWL